MIEIVVLPYGFVLVGEIEDDGVSDYIITRAAVLRRWGAAQGEGGAGLGICAREGPRHCTLDPTPKIRVPRSGIIWRTECTSPEWEKALTAEAARTP